MKRKLVIAALTALSLASASCGTVDSPTETDNSTTIDSIVTADSSKESEPDASSSEVISEADPTVESEADSSETNTDSNSTAEESSSSESLDSSESDSAPKVKEHNPHMSEEPTSETSLAIDEGGCKNPDEPPHIHYLNDEVDINIVKGIIITTASELEEVELPLGDSYKGGVHPQFEFEVDGVSYSVYMNPAMAANIQINGKYYYLDKVTFDTLSELVYW